jgi:RNA polymerase sigma-70 factor (ECF subfamily)
MPERSDEELMTAYAKGEIAAFEELYGRYRGPLYRFVLRQVGDPATANDLYQGSWEKIIGARRRYRPEAPFRAWMYRIARNHVTDHFRRNRPALELQPERLESPDPGPDQALADTHDSERLEAALDELPLEQKEALLLKLEAGLGLQEIAEVVGVNPETAKSRLRYAVAKLRAVLAEPAGASLP